MDEKSGILLINKPTDWTSFNIVAKLRSITGIKKIGHAGTLDPMAQGLLIVAIGRQATKKIDQIQGQQKQYLATIELGKISSTYDAEGDISDFNYKEIPDMGLVKKVVQSDFAGKIMQRPPLFSAKKINGVRAYKLARKGSDVKLEPRQVEIFNIEIVDYEWPQLKLLIDCSKGTYIRSIAHDLGEKLGVGGYLTYLQRTKIGDYDLKNAVEIADLTPENWSDFLLEG